MDVSLSETLHKINGTLSSDDRGQEDRSSTTMNTARAAAAATANIIVNETADCGRVSGSSGRLTPGTHARTCACVNFWRYRGFDAGKKRMV